MIFIKFSKLILLVITVFFCSCLNEKLEESLYNGLINYRTKRIIEDKLIDGYQIKSLAFFNVTENNYKFVFHLNSKTKKEIVSKYSLGMVVYGKKEMMGKDKNFLMWTYKPSMEIINTHKYIVTDVITKVCRIDSLHVYLFDRSGYKRVLGDKMIRLKNIKL